MTSPKVSRGGTEKSGGLPECSAVLRSSSRFSAPPRDRPDFAQSPYFRIEQGSLLHGYCGAHSGQVYFGGHESRHVSRSDAAFPCTVPRSASTGGVVLNDSTRRSVSVS